ncbi:helicase-exonuclease AddAB subunit AddA [Velocimicrobium porci]|uniref:ATP-dependent helicase/nuclease subunit A n=1 Tax=Velocimicrobium porci TaxID=2606634 RepID=A0A6L5XVE1_9FIRM|nr:helicase-exonuclease AddAB subunit AddA [Velocimicrobium porci]MSS62579.1 helicase-exonuclease AddAB subunit AddA [Velocimicrobium porci]
MAKMEWTKEQKKVIDTRNRNVLVSAAAGSGKTAVLVERIISMILDETNKIDIDRLLIVTFTEAAAGEMRERIGNAIEEKLKEQPENIYLQKQNTLLHNAQITTIHSFCLNVIRNHFNTIDLDPAFRIGDETELMLLKSDVLSELLEERYQGENENFFAFIESYATGKSDSGIEDMVLKLHSFAMSYPWPLDWMRECEKGFFIESLEEMNQTVWMGLLRFDVKKQLEGFLAENEALLLITEEPDGPYLYAETLESDRAALKRIYSSETYEELYQQFQILSWNRLSSKKDETIHPEKREAVKVRRDRIKKEVEKLKELYFFQTADEMLEDIINVRPAMEGLIELTVDFTRAYQEKKEEKNLLDFSDLEHFALQILVNREEKEVVPTPVAEEYKEYFKEILIDEYQDSNYVQEAILTSISKVDKGEPNIFMVGDVKQSIYKFRLARPELFIQKYDTYTKEDSLYQKIDLHKNFRSRAEVLEGINYIFQGIMHRSLGNVEYDDAARLYPGADYPNAEEQDKNTYQTECLLIEQDEEVKMVTAKELEARAIAKRIREFMGKEKFLVKEKDTLRPLRYKDIVILLRSPKSWTDGMIEAFKEEGIPVVAEIQTGYFSSMEVKTILNYLLIIDNPRQDIPFTAVLTSFLGHFTEEELGKIRINNTSQTMYESLNLYIQANQEQAQEKELCEKINQFLGMLSYFRDKVAYTTVYHLLEDIYDKTGFYHYVSVLPGGNIRKGNLDMLLWKAVDYESTSYGGLFHFNRYIERLHEYDIDFGEAAGQGGEDDVVRIMSIHKSKGLEFPVVFVAGMAKLFNQQDARSRLVLHPDLGIGPDYIDYENRTKSPTLIKKVMKRQLELENLGEELRVLYVALTRAKEKLILTATVKDAQKEYIQWQNNEKLLYQQLALARCYMDWIGPRIYSNSKEKESCFSLKIISLQELVQKEVWKEVEESERKEELFHWDSDEVIDESIRKEFNRQIYFEYPYQNEKKIHSKVTVSELKEDLNGEAKNIIPAEREAYVPAFAKEEEEVTSTRKGTLYHKVMEKLPFEQITSYENVEQELEKLCENEILSFEDIKWISRKKIYHFICSPLGKRMAQAKKENRVFNEQPFVFGVPACEIDKNIDSDEIVLVQGMVDSYFEEDGFLILMDYKTDRVKTKEELIEKYQVQLDYYQRALEQITGKKVKEKIIYSFYLEQEIILQ